ncbi:hypothetical protein PR048_005147 [Dryococelus australis]|uniref:GAG-pre-integrase domain-containing protein n=1 Tax=Dryococelus australis TaxID=614101 RepID=A0ABQ9I898_9NEOP|nr:hypothetical protein PR048_005147 [Dryococelus australis]
MHEALGHIGSNKLYETLRDMQEVETMCDLCQRSNCAQENLQGIVHAKAKILLAKVKGFVAEVVKARAILYDNSSQFTIHFWQTGLNKLYVIPTTASVRNPRSNPVECRMSVLGKYYTCSATTCNNPNAIRFC